MGMTSVKMKVMSSSDPKRSYQGEFLVDSGAHFTVLPKAVWEGLGLRSEGEQEFGLAEGKVITRKIGNALVEFRGETRATPVVLGNKDDSPLLGIITLEALGLGLDPFKRELYKAKLMLA